MADRIDIPECEKLASSQSEMNTIRAFLEFLQDNNIRLAEHVISCEHLGNFSCSIESPSYPESCDAKCDGYGEYESQDLYPVSRKDEDLLMDHFGIDQKKLEVERRALLEGCRQANEEREKNERSK